MRWRVEGLERSISMVYYLIQEHFSLKRWWKNTNLMPDQRSASTTTVSQNSLSSQSCSESGLMKASNAVTSVSPVTSRSRLLSNKFTFLTPQAATNSASLRK